MAAQVPSRLYRSRSQKMIAGVCGGLGEYFDVDPVLIRLMFVVTTFISGAGILAYIILWIVVPFEGDDTTRMDALKRDFDDLTGRVREYIDPARAGAAAGGSPGAPGPAGGPQGGPDVAGYHGGFGAGPYGPGTYGASAYGPGPQAAGPYGPGPHGPGFGAPAAGPRAGSASDADPNLHGGASSAASPFETSRDASMTSDTATARVPGADTPSADQSGPQTAESTPQAAGEEQDEAPLSASADARPSAAAIADDDPFKIEPPSGTPPVGTTSTGQTSSQTGPQAEPQAGPQAGPGSGTPPFGSPYGPPPGTPPFGAPFGAAAGGSASAYGWTSAPRDSGPASGSPFSPPAAPPSERKRRRQHWAGAILILIGMLILASNLGLLWWLEFEYFLPLVLVGLGAWLLFGRGRRG